MSDKESVNPERADPVDQWNLKYNLVLEEKNQLAEKCAKLQKDLEESQKWEVHWQRENNVIANEAEKYRYQCVQLETKIQKFLKEHDDESF